MNQELILTVLVGLGILFAGLGIIIITEKVVMKEKPDQRKIITFKTRVYSLNAENDAFKLLMDDNENARINNT